MAKLKKKMCKLARHGLEKKQQAILTEVCHPRYICTKCLRTASRESLLCCPLKLDDSLNM